MLTRRTTQFTNSSRRLHRRLSLILLLSTPIIAGARMPITAAQDGSEQDYAYYTERYWKAAAARADNRGAGAQAHEEPAYYTERYWQMAARREAVLAAQETDETYAYYTERYWRAAARRQLELASRR